MKKCSKCQEIKPLNDFYFAKHHNDGHTSQCKKCTNEKSKQWRKNNPEKVREASRRWVEAHPEKALEKSRKWRKANPEKQRESVRQWGKANVEKVRQWQRANPEKMKEKYRRADAKKRGTPKGRLNESMSVSMRTSLHGNKCKRKWEILAGYTVDDLKKHLEKQFKEGMSWENYNRKGWHIDHKIPKSVFNYEKPEDEDFKRCWALENLQPLWAFDNISKHNKLSKPFQPKLIFK